MSAIVQVGADGIETMAERIIRVRDVVERIGVSRSTLYEWVSQGRFPQSIPLGACAVGWREADVDEWIVDRARRARGVQDKAEAARTAA